MEGWLEEVLEMFFVGFPADLVLCWGYKEWEYEEMSICIVFELLRCWLTLRGGVRMLSGLEWSPLPEDDSAL